LLIALITKGWHCYRLIGAKIIPKHANSVQIAEIKVKTRYPPPEQEQNQLGYTKSKEMIMLLQSFAIVKLILMKIIGQALTLL